MRAGRAQIPFGIGNWLWSRLHVQDTAPGLAAAIESEGAEGEVLNIGPTVTLTVRQWAKAILSAAGSDASLVSVPDVSLPGDLWLSASIGQHILADPTKAQSLLGWRDREATEAISDSVGWHIAHSSDDPEHDWANNDAALASALSG